MDASDASTVDAAPDASTPAAVTASFTPTTGANLVPLGDVAPGLDGANLTFQLDVVQPGDLYFSALQLTAGPGGLVVKGMRLDGCKDGVVVPDPGDRLAAVDIMVAPNETQPVPGTVIFVDAALGTTFAVAFDSVAPAAGAMGDPVNNGGACP